MSADQAQQFQSLHILLMWSDNSLSVLLFKHITESADIYDRLNNTDTLALLKLTYWHK